MIRLRKISQFIHSRFRARRTKEKFTAMNIKDLMSIGGNVIVSVSLDELRAWHDELVAAGITPAAAKSQHREELLTRKETLQMLGVDASTLWRWAKTGYLLPVGYGGRKRYKRDDVEAIHTGQKGSRQPIPCRKRPE